VEQRDGVHRAHLVEHGGGDGQVADHWRGWISMSAMVAGRCTSPACDLTSFIEQQTGIEHIHVMRKAQGWFKIAAVVRLMQQ
jgi:hypothetical protein